MINKNNASNFDNLHQDVEELKAAIKNAVIAFKKKYPQAGIVCDIDNAETNDCFLAIDIPID